MMVANIISVITAWEQIKIVDANGNKIYEGSCSDVRATTTDTEVLYRIMTSVVKNVISSIEDGISYINITVE